MSKAIFTTKPNPGYDDLPERHYHFPHTYLSRVQNTVGDWIIYYEPRRTHAGQETIGGRQAYFAAARVLRVRPDESRHAYYYADVAEYFEFPRGVSFREGTHYYESALRTPDGRTSMAFRNAVRALPENEFDLILQAAFASLISPNESDQTVPNNSGFADELMGFERAIVTSVVARPLREAAFSKNVGKAYDWRCAITGLSIRNGGGRPEVEAAHIRPVAQPHNGPDSVRNGIALSRTAHWLFDRGLVSISDDYRLLVAERHVPDDVRRLFREDGRVIVPNEAPTKPHPQFLEYHRGCIFKG